MILKGLRVRIDVFAAHWAERHCVTISAGCRAATIHLGVFDYVQ